MIIEYERILSVQVRDGVATHSSKVWWHGEDGPELVDLTKPYQLSQEWENIFTFPLVYSLQEPTYELDVEGFAVYDYEYPYKD